MPIPALFTSMSMPPSCDQACSTARVTDASARTSSSRPIAFGNWAATSAARAPDLPVSATAAPVCARAVAMARPRPLVPPVTSTFLTAAALMPVMLEIRARSKSSCRAPIAQ
jgi:hypothetical protein